MASFNLFWNPVNPYSTLSTQTVEYKRSGDSSYIIYATIPGYKNSYTVEGLEDNICYYFRIGDVCDGEILYTSVIKDISFAFPEIQSSISVDTMTYSFQPAIDSDIESYTINLYKNGIFLTKEIYNEPFLGEISGQFTGLEEGQQYYVETVMTSMCMMSRSGNKDIVETVCVDINDIQGGTA